MINAFKKNSMTSPMSKKKDYSCFRRSEGKALCGNHPLIAGGGKERLTASGWRVQSLQNVVSRSEATGVFTQQECTVFQPLTLLIEDTMKLKCCW